MKVFISWSGDRSRVLAQALRDWLPLVLYFAEPWLSQTDIEAGERWASEVSKELEESNFGIICITKENITSPWILFEAGALAKSIAQGRVIPLLLDIDFKDITGPLAQFQAKKFEKDSMNELIISINRYNQGSIPDGRLTQLFNLAWPNLEGQVSAIPQNEAPTTHRRPQHEILEELVAGVRGLELRFRESVDNLSRSRRHRNKMSPIMIQELLHSTRSGGRDPAILLMISSFFREDYPWIYELGVDAYRAALDKNDPERDLAARHRLFSALRSLRRGPFLEATKDDIFLFDAIDRLMSYAQSVDAMSSRSDRDEQSDGSD